MYYLTLQLNLQLSRHFSGHKLNVLKLTIRDISIIILKYIVRQVHNLSNTPQHYSDEYA